MPTASPKPGKTLLNAKDHTLILIDHQSQMAFATKSIEAITLRNNAALVAKAARLFGASTILTTVAEKTFSGPIFGEIKSVFPDAPVIDRSTMVQCGAVPMTSLQYLLELQRDWARKETYAGVSEIAVANGGAYGLGMIYAGTMFGAGEGH